MILYISEEVSILETMFWVWLAVIVVALVIEIATLELVSIWFSIGAVIPFILAAIDGVPIEIQIVVFVAVSALLIIFLRKIAQKWLLRNSNTKTNIDVQIGKVYRMLEDADFEKNGSIKINDIVWTAVSENGEHIEKGQLVEIVKVDGNKMIVKKTNEEQNSKHEDKQISPKEDVEDIQFSVEQENEQSKVPVEQDEVIESQKVTKEENLKTDNVKNGEEE